MGEKCVICSKIAEKSCSGCKQAYYCSRDHQREDWNTHRSTCHPFQLKEDQDHGRFMVATKDIDIGTILFKEAPLAVGPFKDRSLTVLCLGCYLPLRNQKFRCSKCHIPLCSKACETRSEHARECNHFRTKPDLISQTEPFSNWDCIFPLRILLLKDQYPDKYQLIQDLVTNRRLKESSPDWKGLLECCDTLTDQFQLDIDREEVLDILCALDSNSYQVLSKGVFETMSGIYPRASMLNHSCISNTRPIIVSDYGMKVVTTAKIARGQEISSSYVPPLYTTIQRRSILFKGKFFHCSCPRCSDSTEFGSFASALKCQSSRCDGFLIPQNSLELESSWECQSCQAVLQSSVTLPLDMKLVAEAQKLEMASSGGIKCYQRFLAAYAPYLHPNHAFLCYLKQKLCEKIGRVQEMNASNMKREDWEYKVDLAKHLVDVYNKIEAPQSYLSGLICLELGEALIAIGSVVEAKQYISRSQDIFRHEDPASADGKLRLKADALWGAIHH